MFARMKRIKSAEAMTVTTASHSNKVDFTARRQAIIGLGTAAGCLLAAPRMVRASVIAEPQLVAFKLAHGSEKFYGTFAYGGRILPEAMQRISHLFRDVRNGSTHAIDPELIRIVASLQSRLGVEWFEIVSGYRCPGTNKISGGAQHSYHMRGQAVDIRCDVETLHAARRMAIAMRQGGVGWYPHRQFLHVDTGPVRKWSA